MWTGLGALVAIWASATFGFGTALAQQGQGDVFSSQGYDPFAVGGAHRWYDNHTEDVKQRSSGCLSLLDEAKAYQDKALALYEQAKQPGNSRNQSALVKQANEQIAQRTIKLKAFQDCVNQAIRAKPPGDVFASSGDGEKGIRRVPDPAPALAPTPRPAPPPTPPPRTVAPPPARRAPAPAQPVTLGKVVDDCFSGKDALYRPPDWSRFFSADELKKKADFRQAFAVAGVGAEQALQIDERASGAWNDRELMLDYLVGWVAHCLYSKNVTPQQDPREPYERYMKSIYAPSVRDPARLAKRNENFFHGFSSYPLPPFWDRDPSSSQKTPSDRQAAPN